MSELGIRSVQFAPDGQTVTWLAAGEDGPRTLDLWSLHVPSGRSRILVRAADLLGATAEQLSDEEKARRERKRLSDSFGITEYAWAPKGDALLFPLSGHLYLVKLTGEHWEQVCLTATSGEVTDPQISPGGRYASYVRDRHLWAVELSSLRTLRLSADLAALESAGVAEFIAQEEMHRFTGYWWAPDDRFVAYAVVDEAPVEVVKRMEVYADRFATVEQRYPYAGAANAEVRLCVRSLVDPSLDRVTCQLPAYEYLCRVRWDKPGSKLLVQVQPREQTSLQLYAVDPEEGAATLLLQEEDAAWINLNDDLTCLRDGRFIWGTERSGFHHLELRSGKGELLRPLTSGDWVVGSVRGLDVAEETLYFDGFKDSPLELHLYGLDLKDPQATPRRLTEESGWHETTLGAKSGLWVDVYSNAQTPPTIRLHRLSGERLADLSAAVNGPDSAPPADELTFGELPGPDNTKLYYRLRLPKHAAGQRLPAVVHVYGGPGAQMVQKRWMPRQAALEARLVAAGFAVFALDNRGSPHRGKRFESVLKLRFGEAELDDQACGARWLAAQDFIDGERIGICGASYGGYMTIRALLRAGDLFKVGVSSAPVTDWHLYDTHYTERYLGSLMSHPEVYERSSVLAEAANLQGKLLLVHGMADDNVLYTHSTKLYKALQDAGKMFDIMVYPGEKHGITGAKARSHQLQALVDYFRTHLG